MVLLKLLKGLPSKIVIDWSLHNKLISIFVLDEINAMLTVLYITCISPAKRMDTLEIASRMNMFDERASVYAVLHIAIE